MGLGCGYFAEKQFLHNSFDIFGLQWSPTFLTNVPRIIIGEPIVLDYDQYWQQHLIQKYLPDIPQEQYISKHNNMVSQINSSKANQVLKNNWNTLSENATSQELKRIRLGQGYLFSNITRK